MARLALGAKCGSACSPPSPSTRGTARASLPSHRGQRGDAPRAPASEELAAGFGADGFACDSLMLWLRDAHLFKTSSRFSNWLATIVQAADSAAGPFEAGDSPTASSILASSWLVS